MTYIHICRIGEAEHEQHNAYESVASGQTSSSMSNLLIHRCLFTGNYREVPIASGQTLYASSPMELKVSNFAQFIKALKGGLGEKYLSIKKLCFSGFLEL